MDILIYTINRKFEFIKTRSKTFVTPEQTFVCQILHNGRPVFFKDLNSQLTPFENLAIHDRFNFQLLNDNHFQPSRKFDLTNEVFHYFPYMGLPISHENNHDQYVRYFEGKAIPFGFDLTAPHKTYQFYVKKESDNTFTKLYGFSTFILDAEHKKETPLNSFFDYPIKAIETPVLIESFEHQQIKLAFIKFLQIFDTTHSTDFEDNFKYMNFSINQIDENNYILNLHVSADYLPYNLEFFGGVTTHFGDNYIMPVL